jgi:Pyridoxamine 5'-phosphate oxidase
MTNREPISGQAIGANDATPTSWSDARGGLETAKTYWLATVRRDGGPHVRPVLAVWLDGALHVCASPTSRKAGYLVRSSRCVITGVSIS